MMFYRAFWLYKFRIIFFDTALSTFKNNLKGKAPKKWAF